MSDVIDFLEQLGQDAQLRYAGSADLERALIQAGIEPALSATILGADPRLLESLLGADTIICCMTHVPAEEEEEEEEEEDDGAEEEDETVSSVLRASDCES